MKHIQKEYLLQGYDLKCKQISDENSIYHDRENYLLCYDYDNFTSLQHIEYFDLDSFQLKDLDILNNLNCSKIKDMTVSYNQLTNLNFLDKCVNLETFEARNNNIEDISPLRSLTQLEEIYLSHNKIKDFSVFFDFNFSKLKLLTIVKNYLSKHDRLELEKKYPLCNIYVE